MSADLDLVQRAIVFGVAVVSALLNGAGDALVCMIVHFCLLLFIGFGNSMSGCVVSIMEKTGNENDRLAA